MKWRHTLNTDRLSVWESGDYQIRGIGRFIGRKLVRIRWELWHQGSEIWSDTRLSECKDWARKHARQHAERTR